MNSYLRMEKVIPKIEREDLLYPELSYKIVGALFDVHNQIGGGHPERYYQKAVAIALTNIGLRFSEQYYVPLQFAGKKIGSYYLDFLIEDKIILELKRGRYTSLAVLNQTKQYLQVLSLQLAIIASFATDCVVTKRVINIIK